MNKLVICVYFRAPLGGLQDNILATALSASAAGWQVTILCPEGQFLSEHVLASGISGIGTNFLKPSKRAMQVLCEADIVHAHPGPSRHLALAAKMESNRPLFFTVHGAWFDNVHEYIDHLSAVICVSPAIRNALLHLNPKHAARTYCIPNGIDSSDFPLHTVTIEPGHVVVASRYDTDKRLVVDTLINLWRIQSRRGLSIPRYTVAGAGTLLPEMQRIAEELAIPVTFAGWQSHHGLSNLFKRAGLVIASGRTAMESLCCGRPTIALASAGVVEVFNEDKLQQATYCNFGGYGATKPSSFEKLLDNMLSEIINNNTEFSSKAAGYIRNHHENVAINESILALYKNALKDHSRND